MTDDYNAIPGLNWSRLRSLRVSPKQFRHDCEHERDDTVSMRIGRATHTLLLEPDKYRTRHPMYGGTRRGKEWEAFAARHAGADILTGVEAATAEACAAAVRSHAVAQRHLREGVAERVVTWTDAETGVECKCRCDVVNGHLVDLKTSRDIQPHAFAKQAAQLGYHGQIAFYADGLVASGYELHHDPAIVAVCNAPPHDVVVYELPAETVEAGRRLYKRLLARYVECRDSGEWPGIAEDGELFLLLPEWANVEVDEPITIGGKAVFA